MMEDHQVMNTDDFDDMSEAEFDEAFAAGEPAEIVRDHRIRVEGGGRTVTSPEPHTWTGGRPLSTMTVSSSRLVSTRANG